MATSWALQGQEEQELVIQGPKTHCWTKLSSAEPSHLGDGNNRGVEIKMPIGLSRGRGAALSPPSCSIRIYHVIFTQLLTEHNR